MDLFLSGQGKLGQLRRSKPSKDLTSQRAPVGARVSQNELEWARESRCKPKWVRVSKSDSGRVIQSESERVRESLAHKYVKIKIVAKISFTQWEPKKWQICMASQPLNLSRPALHLQNPCLIFQLLVKVEYLRLGWSLQTLQSGNLWNCHKDVTASFTTGSILGGHHHFL